MKKKIILIILLGSIVTFLIYYFNHDEEIYLVSLGDGLASGMTAYHVEGYNYNDYIRDQLEKEHKLEKYIHDFSKADMTVENLLTTIEHNYKLESINLTIQQALSKADILTIALGIDELANNSLKQNLSSKKKDDYIKDMEKLLKLVRNFCNGKIFVLGIYKAYNIEENDSKEVNEFLKKTAEKYKMIFIDIADISNESKYFLLNSSYYLNYKGHREIFNRILQYL